MTEVFMPKAGMDMKEGILIRWLKAVGDPVEKDEPIMEIETDKITMEAEAPASGFLLATYCQDGDVVPVLGIMGYIGGRDEKAPPLPGSPIQTETSPGSLQAAPAPCASPSQGAGSPAATPYARSLAKERGVELASLSPGGKHGEIIGADVLQAQKPPAATPLARRVAEAQGLDIAGLQGSGQGGKVRKADVEKALAAPAPGGGQESPLLTIESRRPLSGMNRVVAERMMQSHTEIPSVTQSILVDMTELMALRAKLNARLAQKLSINDFLLKATAIAVKEHPKARTILQDGEYVTYAEANIGFAVSVEDGLFVPVLHNADLMPLTALSAKAKDLAQRARSNQLRPDECAGGVFTVSNMGMYDVWDFTPIINQPQSGILGIGAAQDMLRFGPDGGIVARKICKMFITYDHRIMDGVSSAKIKLRVRELLEHPEELLLI